MLLYLDPVIENKLSPSLKRLLEGKTCFQITELDPDLLKNIEAALSEGAKYCQHRSWL